MSSKPLYFRYAGCSIRADFPLPELAPTDEAEPPAFRLGLDTNRPVAASVLWSHDFPDSSGQPTLHCERTATGHRLRFPGVATLVASPGGCVKIHPDNGASMELVRHVLLDQALPRLLAQRGELVLHAAVVATASRKTLLLLGDSGRGKSTLTGAFLASGRSVGTDDGALVRIADGALMAFPTYSSLRLLSDARAHLFAGVDAASLPVAGYNDKRRLPVQTALGATRVDAIVLLAPPLEDGTAPRLIREPPRVACMAMIQHGFQLDLSDAENLQVLLAKAAEAAEIAPVYRLQYPRRYDALPDVLALLEAEA